jgi:hypothetical protein
VFKKAQEQERVCDRAWKREREHEKVREREREPIMAWEHSKQ